MIEELYVYLMLISLSDAGAYINSALVVVCGSEW